MYSDAKELRTTPFSLPRKEVGRQEGQGDVRKENRLTLGPLLYSARCPLRSCSRPIRADIGDRRACMEQDQSCARVAWPPRSLLAAGCFPPISWHRPQLMIVLER